MGLVDVPASGISWYPILSRNNRTYIDGIRSGHQELHCPIHGEELYGGRPLWKFSIRRRLPIRFRGCPWGMVLERSLAHGEFPGFVPCARNLPRGIPGDA